MSEIALTRDEVVMIAQAVEEHRDEYSGPHMAENKQLAEHVRKVLPGTAGDQFVLKGAED